MSNGFERIVPSPRPVVYKRFFTEEEILQALTLYMKNQGHDIPVGKTDLYGFDYDYHSREVDPIGLTMRIERME